MDQMVLIHGQVNWIALNPFLGATRRSLANSAYAPPSSGFHSLITIICSLPLVPSPRSLLPSVLCLVRQPSCRGCVIFPSVWSGIPSLAFNGMHCSLRPFFCPFLFSLSFLATVYPSRFTIQNGQEFSSFFYWRS